MKNKLLSLLLASAMLLCLCACAAGPAAEETRGFTDSCGRSVTLPAKIERVAPSGSVAQMMLLTIAPELLVGLSNMPDADRLEYLPQGVDSLPVFGQFYGGKSNLNMESLMAADPQIIIDLGERKKSVEEDMDSVQEQTGIPTVFIQADLDSFADAYRTLGDLLGRPEKAEKIASYIEDTIAYAAEKRALIAPEDRITVMYAVGEDGLNCNARGSAQADVIELIGAENAIVVPENELSSKNGGNTINMEQLYNFAPDCIIFNSDGAYDAVAGDRSWQELEAVKEGRYYEIPSLPYNWMSNPPSVNRILGIWWLGNLLYPGIYDYDICDKVAEFYSLFYDRELSRGDISAMLERSTFKNG
jgi:iron complex transport system substrate-binding protein